MSATIVTCPICEDSFSIDEYGNCKNHFYTSAYTYKINKEFYYNGIKDLYEKVNAKAVFENLVGRAFLFETNLFPMLRLILYLEGKGAVVKNISKTNAGVVIKMSANIFVHKILNDPFFLLVEEIKYKKHQSYFSVTINPDNLRLFKHDT